MVTARDPRLYELRGLSTDTKPTKYISNGSIFIEIDTSKYYIFDEANLEWLVYTPQGGGGGGGGGEPDKYIKDASVSSDGTTLTLEKKNGSKVIFTPPGDVTKEYVDAELAKKQDTLTAGNGIEILKDETSKITTIKTIIPSAPETEGNYVLKCSISGTTATYFWAEDTSAKLTKELTASYAVGSVSVGQVFTKDTPIEEIIVAMLHNDTPSDSKIYFGSTDEIPTGISASFTSETLPSDFLTNGIAHTYSTTGNQYICLVYPTSAGDLKHIYENGLTFDLLSNFNKSVVTYNSILYNLYYYSEAATITSSDFIFKWN